MADTVSNTTFSFDINSKVLEAFNALPSPCSDDTVIALGARLYIDTNHFISDLSEINRLTRKLCDDDIIAYKEGGEPNQFPSGFVASWKID